MLRKARLRIFMHECQEQYFFFLEIFNLLMSMTIFPPYIAGLSNNLEPAEGLKIWEGSQLYKIYFALVWPNLTNLTPLSPNFDPGGPTPPDSTQIWTLRTQPDPKSDSNRVHIKFIRIFKVHYRVEPKFEPFLRPTRPNWTHFTTLRANQTRLNPSVMSTIGFIPQNGSALAALFSF